MIKISSKNIMAIAVLWGFLIPHSLRAQNLGYGTDALFSITTGVGNVAIGDYSLYSNGTSCYNTAVGEYSLYSANTGWCNTALGYQALYYNTNAGNTGLGYRALYMNVIGGGNTAVGDSALYYNTSGGNTAVGQDSLALNTTGSNNVGLGAGALGSNTTGTENVAVGAGTLFGNVSGVYNTALGFEAGYNSTGSYNILIGHAVGPGMTGDSNIYIGNYGSYPGENFAIRIGANGTVGGTTFIAGIFDSSTSSGLPVYVDANDQLGTVGVPIFPAIQFNLPPPVGAQPAQLAATGPQAFTVVFSATTNNSTTAARTAELTLDGNTPDTTPTDAGFNVLIPPAGAGWGYMLTVTGRGKDSSGNSYTHFFQRSGILNCSATGVVTFGSTLDGDMTSVYDSGASGWTLTQNRTSPGHFKYSVYQGSSNFTVHWTAKLEVTAASD